MVSKSADRLPNPPENSDKDRDHTANIDRVKLLKDSGPAVPDKPKSGTEDSQITFTNVFAQASTKPEERAKLPISGVDEPAKSAGVAPDWLISLHKDSSSHSLTKAPESKSEKDGSGKSIYPLSIAALDLMNEGRNSATLRSVPDILHFSNVYPPESVSAAVASSNAAKVADITPTKGAGMTPLVGKVAETTTVDVAHPGSDKGSALPTSAAEPVLDSWVRKGIDKASGWDKYYFDKGGPTPPELRSLIFDDSARKSVIGSLAVSPDLSRIDPKKPTVAFLEGNDFDAKVFDGLTLSHAQLSALSAVGHGYNAIMMKGFSESAAGSHDPMPQALNDIVASVKQGILPLGKGDVLNVSMGNNASKDTDVHKEHTGDPTFAEVSKRVGFKVTPENLKANRERIMAALDKLAALKTNPVDAYGREWRDMAQNAIDSSKAIKELQKMGIEIVHAAGNDGLRVDLNFLYADHNLASVDAKTRIPDAFSNRNSLTEDADGLLEMRRKQPGRYSLGDVPILGTDLCAINHECSVIIPPKGVVDTPQSPWRAPLPTETERGELVGVWVGTSYSDVDYLERTHDKYAAAKLQAYENLHNQN